MIYVPVDTTRCCEICGGPITPKNKTGICTRTRNCRSTLQKRINGSRRGPQEDTPDNCPWLLPIVYEIDEDGALLFFDAEGNETDPDHGQPKEIIDQVAIDVAVQGLRHVGLTTTERKIVVERMIKGSWDVNEIAHHCGTTRQRLDPIFHELGYEVVPTVKPNGKRGRATIRPIKEPDVTRVVAQDLKTKMQELEAV